MTDISPPAAGGGRTILFIHGLWLTSQSWEPWRARFDALGHRTLAPEWPGMEKDIEAIRAEDRSANNIGITEVVDSYTRIINGLDEPPILIGHSFGGLIVQLLLDRGLGAAGVAVSPAPFKGVLRLPISTLRSSSPVLANPTTRKKLIGLTTKQWHYGFTNTLSREESDEFYRLYHAPTPARPLWQAAFANFNPKAPSKLDLKKADRPPLLILANGADHVVPVAVSREAYQRQSKAGAVTAFHEFPGRPHLTANVPGWEDVADYALAWALDPVSGEK